VEPRVVQADNAGLFTLEGTRTHLVGRREVAVLDPGPADPRHIHRLVEALSQAEQVSILLTHFHSDHWEGTLPLVAALLARTSTPLSPGALRVLGPRPPAGKIPPGLPELTNRGLWAPLDEGASVSTDQGSLRALWTPGHAEAHLAFHWLQDGSLFPGDLLIGAGNTVWVAGYPTCVQDYLDSLDRLEETGARLARPAHGAPLADLPGALQRFRAHRRARLEEVQALHRESPDLDVAGLTHRIYGAVLPPRLRPAAAASVRAMLEHLGIARFPREAVDDILPESAPPRTPGASDVPASD
jgi:glyoxylase-like metal-dependent hydrolase (beta-lactamase superfamily II)